MDPTWGTFLAAGVTAVASVVVGYLASRKRGTLGDALKDLKAATDAVEKDDPSQDSLKILRDAAIERELKAYLLTQPPVSYFLAVLIGVAVAVFAGAAAAFWGGIAELAAGKEPNLSVWPYLSIGLGLVIALAVVSDVAWRHSYKKRTGK